MPAQPAPPWVLYTFAMSHYSEKIRWTLDHLQADYREVCLTPVFHIGKALTLGGRGQTTLPLLQTPSASVQDSPRIIDWLVQVQGPLDLVPAEHAAEVRAVAQRFDAIGKDVARVLYAGSFGSADAHIVKLWTDHASAIQAAVIRAAYPVIRWAFRRKLNITPHGVARAHQRITESLDWLDARLADGRPHLVGDRLTVADITAASLLAPLACPVQHPVYGEPAYRHSMARATAPFKDRPALAWVRALYDGHRGPLRGGVFAPRT